MNTNTRPPALLNAQILELIRTHGHHINLEHLNQEQRRVLRQGVAWYKRIGMSKAEISRKLHVNIEFINRWYDRSDEDLLLLDAHRSGGPRTFGSEDEIRILCFARENSDLGFRALANHINSSQLINHSISHTSIANIFSRHGWRRGLLSATVALSDAAKSKRVQWCREHFNENWRDFVFQDTNMRE